MDLSVGNVDVVGSLVKLAMRMEGNCEFSDECGLFRVDCGCNWERWAGFHEGAGESCGKGVIVSVWVVRCELNLQHNPMMRLRGLGSLVSKSLVRAGQRAVGHIKNMDEENVRVTLEQMERESTVVKTSRVYKPTYTIEFNREGEALLYSANPIKNETIYFKYPYILYESLIPLSMINYVLNPLELVWYWNSFALYFSPFLVCARIWYWRDFMYFPNKLFLLRGGRVLKVEAQSLGNLRYVYWAENQFLRPLTEDKMRFDDRDNADFLTEEGQLKYNLNVEAEEIRIWGVNMNNEQLHFLKHGTVHHPELFEAAVKGFNIDTTDFVINTADNVRYREPNYDQ